MLRPIAAALFTAITSLLLLVQFASMFVDGGTSPALMANDACTVEVAALGRAEPGGLRTGDRIAMPPLDPAARIYLETGSARADASLHIPVSRAEGQADVVSPRGAPGWSYWIVGAAVKIIIYVVGLVVLWRGRDATAWLFGASSLAIAVVINPTPTSILPPQTQAALYAAMIPSAEIAALLFYFMIERLSRPDVPGGVVMATRTVAVAGLLIAFFDNLVSPASRMRTGCVNAWLATAHPPAYIAALVATVVLLGVAYAKAAGQMRQRLRWIVVSTIVGFSGIVVYLAAQLVGHPIPEYPIVNGAAVAIPLGYAYAIMRHRVIDVGFAINRAIVFTALTSVVVAAFALLSGALERAAVGPGASVALQVAIALAIALSFNALEKRVEHAIDRVFFQRKHRATAALAQLADEAPFVHSADVLLERVIKAVRSELGPSGAAIYGGKPDSDYECSLAEGAVFPKIVPIDDPAFVRLRTYLRDVDLSDVDSLLGSGGAAFPLAAQGRLTGALVLGPRASEEAYDPDERASLKTVALRVAAALESLRAREHAVLVKALAEGTIGPDEARARAQELLAES